MKNKLVYDGWSGKKINFFILLVAGLVIGGIGYIITAAIGGDDVGPVGSIIRGI